MLLINPKNSRHVTVLPYNVMQKSCRAGNCHGAHKVKRLLKEGRRRGTRYDNTKSDHFRKKNRVKG